MSAARFFQALSTRQAPNPWDEHRSHAQRYGDLVCLYWGAEPRLGAQLVPNVPPERRERCGDEYRQGKASWERLLRPHANVVGSKGDVFWSD